VVRSTSHSTTLTTTARRCAVSELQAGLACRPACSRSQLRSEGIPLALVDTNLSGASSGYAVHVCAAARPRASCPCHWGCRLLFPGLLCSESLRLGSARSGYAVHVCAAARPRASCPCHWGCRLLRCGAGVRWAQLDLAWEFGSPGHVGAALRKQPAL
jgi:hypothetical protein